MTKALEITIANPEATPKSKKERAYLDNFTFTVLKNVLSISDYKFSPVRITGFKDREYMRRFESALLRGISTDGVCLITYTRIPDELNLTYTVEAHHF